MSALLLSAHILGAIVFVGSITVAASLFPRHARLAYAALPAHGADLSADLGADLSADLSAGLGAGLGTNLAVVRLLHRITRTYALVAITVPVLGIATALSLHVLGETWVMVSTTLTLLAALILALVVVPAQRRVLASFEQPTGSGSESLPRVAMVTGVFNLIWVAVVVLMVLRPGSTTLLHP